MLFGSDCEVAKSETQMPCTPNYISRSSIAAFCSPAVSTPDQPNRVWNTVEVRALVKAVANTDKRKNETMNWMEISKKVNGKTTQQCRDKFCWMKRTESWPDTIEPSSSVKKRPAVKQTLMFDSPVAKKSKPIVAGRNRSANQVS